MCIYYIVVLFFVIFFFSVSFVPVTKKERREPRRFTGNHCVGVCVVCVFITLYMTAQSGFVIYSFYAVLPVCVCVCCIFILFIYFSGTIPPQLSGCHALMLCWLEKNKIEGEKIYRK